VANVIFNRHVMHTELEYMKHYLSFGRLWLGSYAERWSKLLVQLNFATFNWNTKRE